MAARKAKTAAVASKAKAAPKAKGGAKKAKATRVGGAKAVAKVVAEAKKVKRQASTKTKAKSSTKSSAKQANVHKELARLAEYIDAAKAEIAAIRPDDVKDEYLPSASDQLDAVVDATAEASNTIMDACDVVESVMGDVSDEVSATLMGATTRIYEACTFQDITGQRITKVVTTMKHIEDRIDALLETLGDHPPKKAAKKAPKKKTATPKAIDKTEITDADLLEGPQLEDKAKSQAEIDDLLASFD